MTYTDKKAVLITGAQGGIGATLCRAFADKGWHVIATGRGDVTALPAEISDADYIQADLKTIATDDPALAKLKTDVHDKCIAAKATLKSVINNAAIQILGKTADLSADDMMTSYAVNTLAPFRLTQCFLDDLTQNNGSVLNIGTVHAQSTKSEFVAYATSKTAMHGLTRALAVDLGGQIRVNTLAPAATETPMLKAGFAGRDAAYQALAEAHPMGRIAQTDEIAKAALFLCSDDASFITGATLYADGGILSRLHDPA